MNKKGLLLVISGPSGAGKGTVVKSLLSDNQYVVSISATTRTKRVNEREGKHYFFKSVEEFKTMADEGAFLEWAEFCGNYYGTPRDYVEDMLEKGKDVILEIEVQGALDVKKIHPEGILIFVIPPTLAELNKRLHERGTENEDTISQRMNRAAKELALIEYYDYIVINDELNKTADCIKSIVMAEKLKPERNKEFINCLTKEIVR